MDKQTFRYEDILYEKRPVIKKHPLMSMYNRAAQFAPFAALTGHKEAIREKARITEDKINLDENEKMEMDCVLHRILYDSHSNAICEIVYFKKDERKSGGEYLTVTGKIKKVDEYDCCIVMESGEKISFSDVYHIEVFEK